MSRENTLLRCGKIPKCGRNLLRRFTDGRSDEAYLGGRRCVGRVHSVVYNASAASAVMRGAGHMFSEKSQLTQNGTMVREFGTALLRPARSVCVSLSAFFIAM